MVSTSPPLFPLYSLHSCIFDSAYRSLELLNCFGRGYFLFYNGYLESFVGGLVLGGRGFFLGHVVWFLLVFFLKLPP